MRRCARHREETVARYSTYCSFVIGRLLICMPTRRLQMSTRDGCSRYRGPKGLWLAEKMPFRLRRVSGRHLTTTEGARHGVGSGTCPRLCAFDVSKKIQSCYHPDDLCQAGKSEEEHSKKGSYRDASLARKPNLGFAAKLYLVASQLPPGHGGASMTNPVFFWVDERIQRGFSCHALFVLSKIPARRGKLVAF